jgi:hypothetical protein
MEFAHGTIYDGLGRVKHASLPRLGASPDGLITSGSKVGRLVELKCPISRQLNGSIPVQYWVQMQLQAEVCDVSAVEYFEVQLGSIQQTEPHVAEFESAISKAKLPWIGKVCVVADHEDDASNLYRYAYSPLFSTSEIGITECMAWKPSGGVILESALWYVRDYYTTTVVRNPRWWESVGKPAYESFWEKVMTARADGRYLVREAIPLFVSEESSLEASDHEARDSVSVTDDCANDEGEEDGASVVGGWQGVASDRSSDLENNEKSYIDSDLESEAQALLAHMP